MDDSDPFYTQIITYCPQFHIELYQHILDEIEEKKTLMEESFEEGNEFEANHWQGAYYEAMNILNYYYLKLKKDYFPDID